MADEHHDEHAKGSHPSGGHGHGKGHGGGDHEEHEGAPEWLISFADNVTLMMGFFVILMAMNLKPAATGVGPGQSQPVAEESMVAIDAAIAIREAFHNPVDLSSLDPNDLPLVQRVIQKRGASEATQTGQKGKDQDVQSIRPTKYFSQGGVIRFPDHSSELDDVGREQVDDIAKNLSGINLIVELRAHTSAAESFDKADRGMQLAHERARTVGIELVAKGFHWEQIRLTACGDNDRIVAHAFDASNHRANQRVEIIVGDRMVREYLQPGQPDSPRTPESSPSHP
ncbi:MAG: flagellar motor protein MotB [Planctomycetota bacterium]